MERDLVEQIKTLAREIGYTACGIITSDPFEEFGQALDNRIKQFPETAELYDGMRKRVDPKASAPWAESIIICVRRYGKYALPEGLTGHIGRNYLADSRLEQCTDHVMPKKMSEGLKRMGLRVRKGGVPDRWAGARAGVTRFGRNCLAYSEHGSWINVQTWLVDARLPADKPALEPVCPEGCRACIDACPTGALVEPFVMRMDRCVAYLTYHAPEPIEPELWDQMGPWIYGCDVCQEVCPINKDRWEPLEEAPWLGDAAPHLSPEALAGMNEKTYREIVHPLFWYIPLDNIKRWHRNALRAVKNPAKS